jgi:hypothetical protein
VDFSHEAESAPLDQLTQPKIEEDVELVEDQEDPHAIAAYYAESGLDDEHKFDHIHYDARLGLAVENLADGVSLEQLWRVV